MTGEANRIISKAIDVLHERGWHQGDLQGHDGSLCVVGALLEARGRVGANLDVLEEAEARTGRAVGLTPHYVTRQSRSWWDLPAWNDDPHTTKEDVLLALKRALAGESA